MLKLSHISSTFAKAPPYASPLTSRAVFGSSSQCQTSSLAVSGNVSSHHGGGSGNGGSEGSSSICSDVSRSQEDYVADLLLSLASIHWSDRKEGLLVSICMISSEAFVKYPFAIAPFQFSDPLTITKLD